LFFGNVQNAILPEVLAYFRLRVAALLIIGIPPSSYNSFIVQRITTTAAPTAAASDRGKPEGMECDTLIDYNPCSSRQVFLSSADISTQRVATQTNLYANTVYVCRAPDESVAAPTTKDVSVVSSRMFVCARVPALAVIAVQSPAVSTQVIERIVAGGATLKHPGKSCVASRKQGLNSGDQVRFGVNNGLDSCPKSWFQHA
jgi:hypothetical protein